MKKQMCRFALDSFFLGLLLTFASITASAQGTGHCEDRCDSPGYDVAGLIQAPNGEGVEATIYLFDWNIQSTKDLDACLTKVDKQSAYNYGACPLPMAVINDNNGNFVGRNVIAAADCESNSAAHGSYSMKDFEFSMAGDKAAIHGGTYLYLAIVKYSGSSGIAVRSWAAKRIDINADAQVNVTFGDPVTIVVK